MKPRIHLPTLPQTVLSASADPFCAYSQKSRRFPTFIQDTFETITYSRTYPDALEVAGLHHQLEIENLLELHGYTLGAGKSLAHWDSHSYFWQTYNQIVGDAIEQNLGPRDIIGHIAGNCAGSLKDRFPHHQHVEWGVGYSGIMHGTHRAFESNAWRSAVLGTQSALHYYDTVIPNCYFQNEFDEARPHEGYLLYMGRLIPEKGAAIIHDLMQKVDLPLLVAGQGDVSLFGPKATPIGVVHGQKKRELLSGAVALLSPTTYLEPFAGVHVEAMLSGTPVISTNWGVYPETITDNVFGFRCDTLQDFVDAVRYSGEQPLANRQLRQMLSRGRWTADTATQKYTRWLTRIHDLSGGRGWGDVL
jgi:glycosyltransferase involved in cell wall biosynthesis